MDIVMHATMGAVIASPWLESQPLAAGAFMFGSVAPDLDSLSRLVGKRAFLKCHQTYLHSIPVIVLGAGIVSAGLRFAGAAGAALPWLFAAGMVVHVLTDLTNTYGVKLLAPLDRRRHHLDSVFFIDIPLWILTTAAVALLLTGAPAWVAHAYAAAFFTYVTVKIGSGRRVARLVGTGVICTEPSAWFPWRFRVLLKHEDGLLQKQVNAVTGTVVDAGMVRPNMDFQHVLEQSDNYRLMHGLSPAYVLTEVKIEGDHTRLTCRDLHHRNFSTTFGDLEIVTDGQQIQEEVFHV